jgi:hypothetical protein
LRALSSGSDKKFLKHREEVAILKGLKKLSEAISSSSGSGDSGDSGGVYGRAIQIATVEDTRRFAMSEANVMGTHTPLGAMNTLSHLNDTSRQYFLDYCPELKMIFPSLHNPSCFGAEPDPLGCFQSLCENGGLKCRDIVTPKPDSTKEGPAAKTRKNKKSDREYEDNRASISWIDSKKGFKLKLTIEKVPQ